VYSPVSQLRQAYCSSAGIVEPELSSAAQAMQVFPGPDREQWLRLVFRSGLGARLQRFRRKTGKRLILKRSVSNYPGGKNLCIKVLV
jgi:hypothetical protein